MPYLERRLMQLPDIPIPTWLLSFLLNAGLLIPTLRWMSIKYIDERVDERLTAKLAPLVEQLADISKIKEDVAFIRGQLSRSRHDDV
jgi:hypothetical protein